MQTSLQNFKNKIHNSLIKPDMKVLGQKLNASLRLHGLLFIFSGLYLLSLVAVDHIIETPFTVTGYLNELVVSVPTTFFSVLTWIFMIRATYMFIYSRPEHPVLFLIKDISFFIKENAFKILPIIIILSAFIPIFTTFKANISIVNPYSWDLYFMELDRVLHFGIDPWRILQPVLGYWWVTFLIDLVYSLWFGVLFFVLIWVTSSLNQDSKLRMQYLLAFLLIWAFGGSYLATIFSSAGPAFYGHLNLGINPYVPLVDYLAKTNEFIPIWAVKAENILWMNFQNGNAIAAASISAMPSLHNSVAVLMALLGWRYSRNAGIAGTIFAILILIGSVHLGWHYAVDGYAGALIAVICWWIAGRITNWYMSLSFIKDDLAILEQK